MYYIDHEHVLLKSYVRSLYMNQKQQQAAAGLAMGIAGAVALEKFNSRNAAILGIPSLLIALAVSLLARCFT